MLFDDNCCNCYLLNEIDDVRDDLLLPEAINVIYQLDSAIQRNTNQVTMRL